MNPGRHPLDAGLSGTTPATGSRVRTATQSPVAWTRTSCSLARSTPDLHGQRGGLGGGQHLGGVDQVVAQLDHLAHARAADVDDAARRRARGPGGPGPGSPRRRPTIRVSVPCLGPGRPTREGGVEEPGAGGGDQRVLGPGHLGVDGRAVHHHLCPVRARAAWPPPPRPPAASSGRRGSRSRRPRPPRPGDPPSTAPSDDGPLDGAPAARGHRHAGGPPPAGAGSWAVPWRRDR